MRFCSVSPLFTAALVAGLLTGCESDSDPDNSASGGSSNTGGTGTGTGDAGMGGGQQLDAGPAMARDGLCETIARAGSFKVDLAVSGSIPFTAFSGSVSSAVQSLTIPSVVETVGECRLVQEMTPFCSPACVIPEICSVDTTCVEQRNQDIGDVTLTGLQSDVMVSRSGTRRYSNLGDIPFPGVNVGDAVTLTASGNDIDGFSLTASGIAPLEGTPEGDIMASAENGMALTWTAQTAGQSSMRILLNVDLHGTSGGKSIVCDVPDTGSYQVPGAMVSNLLDLGVSGFPTVTLTRHASSAIDLAPGCVDFSISSSRALPIAIPGVVSCNDAETDCQPGEVCLNPQRICAPAP